MADFDAQKKRFLSFVGSIEKDEEVCIVAHAKCNDGMISAIFLSEILKKFGLFKQTILFRDYGLGIFKELTGVLKPKGVKRVFILDLGVNHEAVLQFKQFCKEFDVFYIDHHPSDVSLSFVNNLIKTESADCTSLTIYRLGDGALNKKYFTELLCAALVSEFSYQKPENLKLLQKHYLGISKDNIALSEPFKLSNKLGSVVLYYKDNTAKAYELISQLNFSEIDAIHNEVSAEVDRNLKEFNKAESYFNNKLYFYNFKSR